MKSLWNWIDGILIFEVLKAFIKEHKVFALPPYKYHSGYLIFSVFLPSTVISEPSASITEAGDT